MSPPDVSERDPIGRGRVVDSYTSSLRGEVVFIEITEGFWRKGCSLSLNGDRFESAAVEGVRASGVPERTVAIVLRGVVNVKPAPGSEVVCI